MECNRDEATRAKTIAEKKFADKDYTGAKKFTLKAQTLNPLLDGISHMLITLDVYISSENKINGESDWYKVLDVKPSDDDETIKKQYRKLVLILHPDKNKSVGADGAFKIASEAWSLLSDKTKRLAYNQRRNSSQSSGVNGVHIHVNRTTTRRTTRLKNQNYRGFVSTSKLDSFWTICHGCKMHYEYLKVFVNHTLICPNCRKPFHAVEMATPMNIPKPGYQYAYQWNQNSGDHGMCNSGRRMGASGIHWGSSSGLKVPDDMLRREGGVFYGQPPLKRRKVEVRFGEN
ncbi:chaperone protein dnaJ 49 [Lactuca sativa]|nr:chaperone protein dnaJ 49 [Lactuca sativa]